MIRFIAGVLGPIALAGCGGPSLDPAFPVTMRQARAAWTAMEDEPRPLARPVVVLGGIHDPGVAAPALARRLRRVCGDDAPVASVSFFTTGDFESCRRRTLDTVERHWPSADPAATVEVDVVAVSMGGLVARYAARQRTDGAPRLRIRRLFTVSSPHVGARLAALPTFDQRIEDMRPGSAFLSLLNEHGQATDPELVAYVRLDDAIVGTENAAPPGVTALRVSTPPLTLAHLNASGDVRIIADIARRLRGEPPLAADTDRPESTVPAESAVGTAIRCEPEG